ncbi:maleylpyruvate isomerase family mycothiol-dependent enzyme [Vallicoccus soli]|uniref:Maleylpyruvate isomerase family mycothiol-dependent enzyme n=1 Tax=Vallicoccus soli TaxID=2339232 RepID=A0A3A3Z0G4_9ACTN|nr:maleylpyruvate isomerase family mycothiol-dependent enzyme [Vallicoccus soli]RJK95991.1 maleylpyruvate isomerase family mycothiol-dependent enzyme [Vallicoccus soli]
MDVDEVWRTTFKQRLALADLLDDLAPGEWEEASLCRGWRVRDVAAHLTLAQMRPLPAALALLRARGSFDRMVHDTAVARAALPPGELTRRLRATTASRAKAPGISHLEPMLDALVHGQDVAVPLGREHPVPALAGAVAAERVWAMGWPFHARRRLRGFRLAATDAPWAAGEGELVEGPVGALLLVLTGRPAGATGLRGPGAAELRARLAPVGAAAGG